MSHVGPVGLRILIYFPGFVLGVDRPGVTVTDDGMMAGFPGYCGHWWFIGA